MFFNLLFLTIQTYYGIYIYPYIYQFFYKKRYKNQKLIKQYYETNYKKIDKEEEEYFFKFLKPNKSVYGYYIHTQFRNIILENGIITNFRDTISNENRVMLYEYFLPIHIELINQIKTDLIKLDSQFDFLLITVFNAGDFSYLNFLYKSIFISGEKYKIYFMFDSSKAIGRASDKNNYENNYKNNNIIEMLLCIKKNNYEKYSTYLYETFSKQQLLFDSSTIDAERKSDYKIMKLESGVDYFTQKEFYKLYYAESEKYIQNYLIFFTMDFIIFNYNKKLHDYFVLGYYSSLIKNVTDNSSKDFFLDNYVSYLNDNYNYSYSYYRNMLYKQSKIQLKIEKPFHNLLYVYIPSRIKLYIIKYITRIILLVYSFFKK